MEIDSEQFYKRRNLIMDRICYLRHYHMDEWINILISNSLWIKLLNVTVMITFSKTSIYENDKPIIKINGKL